MCLHLERHPSLPSPPCWESFTFSAFLLIDLGCRVEQAQRKHYITLGQLGRIGVVTWFRGRFLLKDHTTFFCWKLCSSGSHELNSVLVYIFSRDILFVIPVVSFMLFQIVIKFIINSLRGIISWSLYSYVGLWKIFYTINQVL